MGVQSTATRIGTLTARAAGVLVLIATSLSWFNHLFNPSPSALATALMLSTLSIVILLTAYAVNKIIK